MIFLDSLSPEDLLILTNVLAVSFSEDKTADEINILGNFIVGVGCLMLTMAAQQQHLITLQAAKKTESAQQNTNNSTAKPKDTTIG